MKKMFLLIFLIFTSALLGASSYEYQPRREFVPNYKYGYKKAYFLKDFNLSFTNPKKNYYPQNSCDSDNCKALLKLIRTSENNIDFAIYGLQDQDIILNALISAQKRGVKIRGIVDKDELNFYKDSNLLFKYFDNVKKDKFLPIAKHEQDDKFTRAKQALMHDKFFIVDDKYVWTGSTNVSAACMTFNANTAITIVSPEVANVYKKEFEQMYLQDKFHNEKILLDNTENISLNNGKTHVSIYFSPKAEVLTNQIRPLIQNSKESIHIAMYYLTHRRIVEDLIDAKNRGVDVKIILDGSFVRDGYAPHEKLREAGVPVKIENWRSKLHSKNAIFDGKIATLGSTNWTSTAELVNDENMIIVYDEKVAKKVERNFQKMWKLIPDEWLYRTPKYRNQLKK